MLAEIFTGERDWSDVFLLVAVVLFVVAAIGHRVAEVAGLTGLLTSLGLACTAFALLLL